jgi:hypothetical protein
MSLSHVPLCQRLLVAVAVSRPALNLRRFIFRVSRKNQTIQTITHTKSSELATDETMNFPAIVVTTILTVASAQEFKIALWGNMVRFVLLLRRRTQCESVSRISRAVRLAVRRQQRRRV